MIEQDILDCLNAPGKSLSTRELLQQKREMGRSYSALDTRQAVWGLVRQGRLEFTVEHKLKRVWWTGVDVGKPDTPREVLVRMLDNEVPEGGRRVTAMWWNGAWRDPWGGSYHGRLADNAITHWKDIDPPFPES